MLIILIGALGDSEIRRYRKLYVLFQEVMILLGSITYTQYTHLHAHICVYNRE